jgi:putative NADH-flavin reductase
LNILIFGASGKTGHELVSQGLKRGHTVTAFVRDPEKLKIQHQNLKVHQGNVADYQSVYDAVKNQDAAVSALGTSKPLRKDKEFVEGIKNIVEAMQKQNVKRIIYESYMGVHENKEEIGISHHIIAFIVKNEVEEHEINEAVIQRSNLEWTIVRAPLLTKRKFTGKYRHGERILPKSPFAAISRADVADFMLSALEERKYVWRKPRIMH